MEIPYHTLWETVHVFFEHRELGDDVGDSSFLYPFLGEAKQQTGDPLGSRQFIRQSPEDAICGRRWPATSPSKSSARRVRA
jgi:D-sedoheptulose 7-phosphate isomerase